MEVQSFIILCPHNNKRYNETKQSRTQHDVVANTNRAKEGEMLLDGEEAIQNRFLRTHGDGGAHGVNVCTKVMAVQDGGAR